MELRQGYRNHKAAQVTLVKLQALLFVVLGLLSQNPKRQASQNSCFRTNAHPKLSSGGLQKLRKTRNVRHGKVCGKLPNKHAAGQAKSASSHLCQAIQTTFAASNPDKICSRLGKMCNQAICAKQSRQHLSGSNPGNIHARQPRLLQAIQAGALASNPGNSSPSKICSKQTRQHLRLATQAKSVASNPGKICGEQSTQNLRRAMCGKSVASNASKICDTRRAN